MLSNKILIRFIAALLFFLFPLTVSAGDPVAVGTWKTAQTIQPFFYNRFLPATMKTQIFSFTNPADQKTALLAGSLDMCGTTLAHAIYSASAGQPIVIVASLCNKCSALVVKKDGPIKSEADLKGKTIGYVPGTMHEILLRETLIRNGISPEKDVKLIRVDFFDMGTALAGGNIDAFLSGEPFPTLAVKKGYGRILSYPYYGDSVGTINAGMIVRRKSIEKNPEKVAALVLAHARATDFL
ncbi:MAG: aliphatic sulfonates ABC transporter substrate-binding protein, partial [Deltaproteobacteria bacterium]